MDRIGKEENMDRISRGACEAFRRLATVLCGLMVALGVTGHDAWAAGKELRVAYMPIANCIQLFVAMHNKYFEAEGIRLTAKPVVGGHVVVPGMEAGEIDIGYSNSFTIILGRDRGFDFQFLVNGALNIEPGNSMNSLLVRADSPIKELKDLEGRRLALNLLASINELAMKVAGKKRGMDLRKVTLQEIDFPNMEPALKNNLTDAVVATEPFRTLMLDRGVARPLIGGFYGVYGDRILVGSWFAKKAWVDKNPELARGFVRAMNRATEYLNRHPEKRAEILPRYTKISPDLAKRITWAAFRTEFLRNDLQVLIGASKDFGYIKSSFPAEDIVSPLMTLQ